MAAFYRNSLVTRLNEDKKQRTTINTSRSKSQPSFCIISAISASLQSFTVFEPPQPSNGMNSRSSKHVLGVPLQKYGAKRDPALPMSSSYASSINGSSPNGSLPDPSTRFNPFAATNSHNGSNLTINSTDSNSVIFDEDGEILSAGPDALWHKLLPTQEYCPSRRLVFSLLLNMRAFVSPTEMLQKLVQNCIFEQNSSSLNFHKRTRTKLFAHVFDFIYEWTTNIPYDFRDQEMRDRLAELFLICTTDAQDKQRFDYLMEDLVNAIGKRDHYEKTLRSLRPNIEDPPEKSQDLCGLAYLEVTPRIVAEQLAQIEMERLAMIGPDEIVDMLSSSSLENLQQPRDEPGKLGDIRHYIDWFNQLTHLVATEVLRHQHKRHRVRCIEFFIDLGKECINIGNFNSLMAIVAGLTVQAVSRLKRTWSRVEKSKLEILQHQLNPSGNFVSYRSTLNAAIWRYEGAKNDTERVIIPFFGLMLKDLYFIHRACLEPFSNGHLNFAMWTQFSDHISNLIKWKSRSCPFKRVSHVLQYLLLAATYSETNMLALSFEYEPAESTLEREQQRQLIAEKNSK